MPMLYTKRNYVMVGNAKPNDRYVATYIMPNGSGRLLLTTQPIERMQSAIRWALDMADQMAGPLEIVPIESEDELLLAIVVAVGFEGIHARKDPEERRAAADLLTRLGVTL